MQGNRGGFGGPRGGFNHNNRGAMGMGYGNRNFSNPPLNGLPGGGFGVPMGAGFGGSPMGAMPQFGNFNRGGMMGGMRGGMNPGRGGRGGMGPNMMGGLPLGGMGMGGMNMGGMGPAMGMGMAGMQGNFRGDFSMSTVEDRWSVRMTSLLILSNRPWWIRNTSAAFQPCLLQPSSTRRHRKLEPTWSETATPGVTCRVGTHRLRFPPFELLGTLAQRPAQAMLTLCGQLGFAMDELQIVGETLSLMPFRLPVL